MADEIPKDLAQEKGDRSGAVVTATAIPPAPPGVSEIQFTAAFMQKPDMFASLSDVRKQQVFENLDKADDRQAKHAAAVLLSNEKLRLATMQDRAEARTKILRVCYAMGLAGLLMFGALVRKGNVDQAMELVKSVGKALAWLLGGAGIAGAARKYFT